jgi:hypothetical protein
MALDNAERFKRFITDLPVYCAPGGGSLRFMTHPVSEPIRMNTRHSAHRITRPVKLPR